MRKQAGLLHKNMRTLYDGLSGEYSINAIEWPIPNLELYIKECENRRGVAKALIGFMKEERKKKANADEKEIEAGGEEKEIEGEEGKKKVDAE